MIKSEFYKRLVTSLFLVTIVLSALFLNKYTWMGLLIIVFAISWFEIISLISKIVKKSYKFYLFISLSFTHLLLFTIISFELKVNNYETIILFILLTCILSDVGGYIVGKSIGGKKLTKISPNKTISGSIGSFIFSYLPFILTSEKFFAINIITLGMVFSISLTCQLGDLFISYLKRKAQVKDTGNFLPGHGGILDRIDGILFAVPISLLYGFIFLN